MQVYGVPVATYGLVGLTTAVLAYATAISGGGAAISEAMSSLPAITESPMSALSNMNPLSPVSDEGASESSQPETNPETIATDSGLESLNPFASSEQKPEEPPAEITGGKKRRRKTPKSKKSKRRGKSHKNKK